MKKIGMRSVVVLIVAAFLTVGLGIYCVKFWASGGDWIAFPVNKHIYTNASLSRGTVTDIDGVVLLENDDDGASHYDASATVRKATLHAVGDKSGNIATGAQTAFADILTGYSRLNGLYSLDGGGSTLTLTIDAGVNAVAYEALNGKNGVVAVYNYKTGDVLCMVSAPTFDPENPPKSFDSAEYNGVFLNRFISATYIPGSVFKLVTTAALLEDGFDYESYSFTCTGSAAYEGTVVTCPSAHGTLTFGKALSHSCNCAYADLGQKIGVVKLMKYAGRFNILTNDVTVSGMKVAKGSMSVKNSGDLAWSALGQGNDLVNPAAFLTFVGSVANGGEAQYPNLVYSVRSSIGAKVSVNYRKSGGRYMSEETANTLAKMMRNNVLNEYGESRFAGMELCAKSGTAEVDGAASHAWFAGFSQREDMPLAFVVVVEHGGGGSKVAGGVAATVLKKCAEELGVEL